MQEAEKSARARRADELRQLSLGLIGELKKPSPARSAAEKVSAVETAFAETVAVQDRVRKLVDADFQGAMKVLDADCIGLAFNGTGALPAGVGAEILKYGVASRAKEPSTQPASR